MNATNTTPVQVTPAQVVTVKGSWTTVRNADGTERKLRNSQVQVLPDTVTVTKAKANAKAAEAKRAAPKAEGDEADTRLVKPDLTRYVVSDVPTATGRKSVDTNDALAQRLRGKSLDETYALAAELLETPEAELRARYKHLNPGMQRMNLGNRMRAV